MQPQPIRRHKLSEQVAFRIEAMIHNGELGAGDQLPSEQALMKLFAVGRPAIREALQSLQNNGLVATVNGTRARVTQPTPTVVLQSVGAATRYLLSQPDGVRHLQDARALFEVALARHAAQHATRADIETLRAALAANHAALDDMAVFERTDVAFHFNLALIARNPIYTATHAAMVEWLTEQRNTSLQHPSAGQAAYRCHRRMFEAIAAGDPDRAEKEVRAHLNQVARLYWRVKDAGRSSRMPPGDSERALPPVRRLAAPPAIQG